MKLPFKETTGEQRTAMRKKLWRIAFVFACWLLSVFVICFYFGWPKDDVTPDGKGCAFIVDWLPMNCPAYATKVRVQE